MNPALSANHSGRISCSDGGSGEVMCLWTHLGKTLSSTTISEQQTLLFTIGQRYSISGKLS